MQCKRVVRQVIDARGLRCPLPLLKLKQALSNINVGEEIEIITTDKGAQRDIPAYLKLTSHRLLEHRDGQTEFSFIVQKEA